MLQASISYKKNKIMDIDLPREHSISSKKKECQVIKSMLAF
jgi:hypothetical protein